MSDAFAHEGLDCFQLAVSIARWCAEQSFPAHRKHLRDQLVRAADAVPLNIAEGAGRGPGDARRNHYRIALGSMAEAAAVLQLIDLPGGTEKLAEMRRVGAMLARMSRQ